MDQNIIQKAKSKVLSVAQGILGSKPGQVVSKFGGDLNKTLQNIGMGTGSALQTFVSQPLAGIKVKNMMTSQNLASQAMQEKIRQQQGLPSQQNIPYLLSQSRAYSKTPDFTSSNLKFAESNLQKRIDTGTQQTGIAPFLKYAAPAVNVALTGKGLKTISAMPILQKVGTLGVSAGISGIAGALSGQNPLESAFAGVLQTPRIVGLTGISSPATKYGAAGIMDKISSPLARNIMGRGLTGLGNVVEDEILSRLDSIKPGVADRVLSFGIGAFLAPIKEYEDYLKSEKPEVAQKIRQVLRDIQGRYAKKIGVKPESLNYFMTSSGRKITKGEAPKMFGQDVEKISKFLEDNIPGAKQGFGNIAEPVGGNNAVMNADISKGLTPEVKTKVKIKPKATELEPVFQRGDITKIGNKIDELLGTDSFNFSKKWSNQLAARETAMQSLMEGVKAGDEQSIDIFKQIKQLENNLSTAREFNDNPKLLNEFKKEFGTVVSGTDEFPKGYLESQYGATLNKPPKITTTTKIQPEQPQKVVLKPQQKIVSPESNIPLTDNIPQGDPVVKIIEALKGAKPIRAEQQKLYSIERGKRVAKVAGVGAKVPGEQGYFAQLGQLKGELPKVQFESIRKQFTQPDIDTLFNKVESTPMSPFEKVTAKTGLSKLLGGQGGTVPTRGELKLLAEVFPPEFIDAALKNRSTLEKVFSMGEEVLNLPRAFMSTLDLSAPMRQGVFLIGRPKQWVPAFKDMFKFAASENAYKGLQENIRSRPTYQAMRDSGLAITDLSPNLLSREESFMSTLPEKIPGFGALNKASNRAYSGFLNKLRADTFDDLLSKAKSLGVLNENPEITKDIAKFVNSATGRGDLGALNKASVVLNGAFFSPRLMASRLNLLNPVYYTKLDPFVRKEALKSLLGFGAVAGSIVGLSNLAGADVVTDPRSADFGKIKVGDTRYDPWGGFQQYIVLGSRLATGEMVSSTTGKEFKLGEGYKPTTRLDIIQRFLESKESPVASFVTSLLKGQTSMGEEVKVAPEIVDRFIPMMAQDLYDLNKEYGSKGTLMALPGMFGVGSQTYTDQIPMSAKTPTGKATVKWRQQPSLGERLVNKVTGEQISDIPKEQWKPLYEAKQAENLKKIDLSSAKARVLETGNTETIDNTLIYLDNGIVKTKDLTPKEDKPKKISNKKVSTKKLSTRKPKQIKLKSIKVPKVKQIKVKQIKVPKAKVIKLGKLKKPRTIKLKTIKYKK